MSDTPQNNAAPEQPLLVIENYHINPAPSWEFKAGTNAYLGYYENKYGEQWVFVYDFDTEQGAVQGGDAEWKNVYPVQNGRAKNLVLSREEEIWLLSCWVSATANRKHRDEERGTKP